MRRLFATIADRYDPITVLLGKARRRVETASRRAGGCGAGHEGARPRLRNGRHRVRAGIEGAHVAGLDITPRMVELAKKRTVLFLVGDMLALPFPDRAFDLVTTEVRHSERSRHRRRAFRGAPRAQTGGLFLSLDFNRPANALVRAVYLSYLTAVGSAVGWALHRDPDTYRYIPESIKRYPGAEAVVARLQAHGFGSARFLPVLGGLMAIHEAKARNMQLDTSRWSGEGTFTQTLIDVLQTISGD